LADSAVAYIDLYSGGRYVYTTADGLPEARLTCLLIADDYIYLGGDRGAARFDRLIEQWEVLDLPVSLASEKVMQINHLTATDDYIFFGTNGGVLRYEIETETFALFDETDGLRSGAIREIYQVGNEIWFMGDKGVDIYSVSQRNWSFLGLSSGFRSTNWIDITRISGDFYFVSDKGIDICDPSNRQVYPFERESDLRGYQIREVMSARNGAWFATDKGLLQYDAGNLQAGKPESWVLYDQSRGSTYSDYSRLSGLGNYVIGEGSEGIDVLNQLDQAFLEPLEFGEVPGGTKGKGSRNHLDWDERGLSYTRGDKYRLGLTGNANYITIIGENQSDDRFWGRLQPYLIHQSGRSINGLYDNTDPDEVLYGAVYRGIDGDLLRLAEGGNRVSYQQTIDPFFGGATIRGGRVMLEAGPRKGQKKRSLLRTNTAVGERVTKTAREFFVGGQATIYNLRHQNLLIGSAEVFLNNRKLPGSDYTLNHTTGQLYFTFPGWELLNSGDIIEVAYQYRLSEEEIDDWLVGGELVVSNGDALQIAVSSFSLNKTNPDSSGDFNGVQVAADVRGSILGGEGQLTTAFGGGSSDDPESEFTQTGSVSGSFQHDAWTISGSIQAQEDSLATLEDRSTEFGYLENQYEFGVRYEPGSSFWLESGIGGKSAVNGEENSYRLEGQVSPFGGTSVFGSLNLFDADADSLTRKRTIASLGMETSFAEKLLQSLKIRSSRLYVLTKLSEVDLDSLKRVGADPIQIRTKSILTRWTLTPSAKINLLPEIRWSESEMAEAGGSYKPSSKEVAPQATIYTRNLIPGVTTYLDGDASYKQSAFDDSTGTRNVSFERSGVAQIDVVPGTYLALLNPFSFRFNLVRNAEDSLLAIDDNESFWDLGTSWKEYPSNILSYRYDSDAIQVSWVPHYHWIIYQSVTELRSGEYPTVQLYSTRVEWKPRAKDQFYFRYTLNRELDPEGDLYNHRPGVEWYRRWSAKTYTRTQLYANLVDEPNLRSYSITPGAYIDQRFAMPWSLGKTVFRLDLSASYKNQTLPSSIESITAGGYCRLDWSIWKGLTSRFRFDGDYERSITTESSDFIWKLEIRLNARF